MGARSARARRTLFAALVAALGALFVARPVAHAGPWTPEPGHGYAKLWLKWLPGFGYHAGDGATHGFGSYHELFFSGYGELGIAPRVALTLHAPFLQSYCLEDPRSGTVSSHVGVGDPALGVRWQALKLGRFAGALELRVRAPLGEREPVQTVYGTDAGNPAVGELRIGAGVWDLEADLDFGYGWDRVYLAGAFGAIARTGGFDDVIVWSAEIGARFSDHWSGRVRLHGYHSVRNGTEPRAESPSGTGNGTTYTGFALEGEWTFVPKWQLGLTFEGGLLGVRRQTGGPVVSVFLATAW